MESLLERLTENPILLGIALVLVAIIVYAMTKRLVKVVLFLIVLLVVYFGYLIMTGQELPEGIKSVYNQVQQIVGMFSDFLGTNKDKLGR
ncbi:MAG: hypothetical protein ACE5EE_09035 [Fidelibacterota bacterium]